MGNFKFNTKFLDLLQREQILDENFEFQDIDLQKLMSLFEKVNFQFQEFESKLQFSKDQFEKLKIVVDNTPCTISWINNKLEYKGINESLQRMYNLSSSEIIGKKIGHKDKENYFYKFAKELFSSPEKSLYKELVAKTSNDTQTFWVVGSKYSSNQEAVIIGIETTELNNTKMKLEVTEKLVDIDDLTGLYNMRSAYQKIERELSRGTRYNHSVAVIMLDLDDFKMVNDGHDHLFGSFVISEVGKILGNSVRKTDLGIRYGGDEFMVLVCYGDKTGLITFCEKIRNTIENYHFQKGEDEMNLTCSLGFALTSPGTSTINARTLVRVADHALYAAKASGKNQIVGYCQTEKPEIFERLKEKKAA